jgi:hypothetical protein
MNSFLANLYGTGQDIGTNAEVEKLAEAQVIDEQLRSEGIDVNSLSGEDILKCAYALFGDESALVKSAQEEGEEEEEGEESEEKEESAEEKVAEADFLGRVMAHAYYQEKNLIEKQAGIKDSLKSIPGHIKSLPGKLGDKARRMRMSHQDAWLESQALGSGRLKAHMKGLANVAKEHPKTVAGLAGGAALAGGGGYAVSRKKKKNTQQS